jgi:hypothetical protein
VHRISEFETAEELAAKPSKIAESYILLRDPEHTHSEASPHLIRQFKSYEVDGGSIGTWLARLWKGEVGAALIPLSFETPWDSSPIISISRTLGYGFFRPSLDGSGWEAYEPHVPLALEHREHDSLIIHPVAMV